MKLVGLQSGTENTRASCFLISGCAGRKMDTENDFLAKYRGLLYNILSWDQLSAFWARLDRGAGWYLYAVGHSIPTDKASPVEVDRFVNEVDRLLHNEHEEDYCGIVYADDLQNPSFVKIYDPNNLGVSCGSSGKHIFPGWIMSLQLPVELEPEVTPNNRKRWWNSLFGA
jgi:hypothetical protein